MWRRGRVKMDDVDVLPSLLCQESESCLVEEMGNEHSFIGIGNHCAADDEYVDTLLEKEMSLGFREDKPSPFCKWVIRARLEAIAWILKTRAVFGFGFQTAFLSMTYFDRFLSRRSTTNEKLWAIRLLAVACLSLAAKMEELKVPALSEFPVEDYNFESRIIQRMELLVLNTLEWKMCSITPFSFIPYFISKLCIESPMRNEASQTVELIWAFTKERSTENHRPSVIAAAAVMLVVDQRLTRKALEMKMNSISQCRFLDIEDIVSCYNLMQELSLERCKEAESLKSPDLSPTQMKSMDCTENSSVTSAIASKRKRLTFSNCDENYSTADGKRPR